MPKQRHDFRGFDDWVEVFRSGRQTNSQGRSREWTDANLDSVVGHFDAADPPPAVAGHPRSDALAYAWVGALKRDAAVAIVVGQWIGGRPRLNART